MGSFCPNWDEVIGEVSVQRKVRFSWFVLQTSHSSKQPSQVSGRVNACRDLEDEFQVELFRYNFNWFCELMLPFWVKIFDGRSVWSSETLPRSGWSVEKGSWSNIFRGGKMFSGFSQAQVKTGITGMSTGGKFSKKDTKQRFLLIKARERLVWEVGQRTKCKINMTKKSSKVYMDWTISRYVAVKGTYMWWQCLMQNHRKRKSLKISEV